MGKYGKLWEQGRRKGNKTNVKEGKHGILIAKLWPCMGWGCSRKAVMMMLMPMKMKKRKKKMMIRRRRRRIRR